MLTSINIRQNFTIGVKVFSNLHPPIKNLNDINVLKPVLKEYLLSHSFYSVSESCTNSQLL